VVACSCSLMAPSRRQPPSQRALRRRSVGCTAREIVRAFRVLHAHPHHLALLACDSCRDLPDGPPEFLGASRGPLRRPAIPSLTARRSTPPRPRALLHARTWRPLPCCGTRCPWIRRSSNCSESTCRTRQTTNARSLSPSAPARRTVRGAVHDRVEPVFTPATIRRVRPSAPSTTPRTAGLALEPTWPAGHKGLALFRHVATARNHLVQQSF